MRLFQTILVLSILMSCRQDLAVITPDSDISGQWKIIAASRDGQTTSLLQNGEYVFNADNTMTSNLVENGQLYPYTISNNHIIVDVPGEKREYTVLKATNDTLIIGSRMHKSYFEFILLKDAMDHQEHSH